MSSLRRIALLTGALLAACAGLVGLARGLDTTGVYDRFMLHPVEQVAGKTGRLRAVTRGCSRARVPIEVYWAPLEAGDTISIDLTTPRTRRAVKYVLQVWKSPVVGSELTPENELASFTLMGGRKGRRDFNVDQSIAYHISVATCGAPGKFTIAFVPLHRALLSIRQMRPISAYRFIAIRAQTPSGGDAWGLGLVVKARWDGAWHPLPTHYKTNHGWSEEIQLPPSTRGKNVTFDVTASEQYYRTVHLRRTIRINP